MSSKPVQTVKMNDRDQVIRYLTDDNNQVTLGAKLQEKLLRWSTARNIYFRIKSRRKTITALTKEFGISEATAYSDFKDMMYVFGEAPGVKDRNLHREMMMEQLRETRRIALAKRDVRGLNANDGLMMKLLGLDRDQAEQLDPSSFRFHQNIILFTPEQMGVNPAKPEEIEKKVMDLIHSMAEDVETDE